MMSEDEIEQYLLKAPAGNPHNKFYCELPDYKKVINERKFKLNMPKHPENFQTHSSLASVDLDGFNYGAGMLCRYVWATQVFKVLSDDVVTASFPKTGSTWLQEIVWIICNNFDFETSAKVDLSVRVPFLDLAGLEGADFENQKRPRHYHCHAPYSLLPSAIRDNKMKVIYVMRNPKDTCVSLYHLLKSMTRFQFKGDIKEYARMFMENEVQWGPFPKHILSYWEHRNEGHVLIVTYEEMQRDIIGCIRKIAAFLNKPVSEEKINKLAAHTSFKSMAQSKTVNREEFFHQNGAKDMKGDNKFMRKGVIGDWKNNFDDETNAKFDKWIEENFGENGPKFIYE